MCKQCQIQIQQLKQRLAKLEADFAKLKELREWRDNHTSRDDLSVLEQGRYITPAAYKLGGNGQ